MKNMTPENTHTAMGLVQLSRLRPARKAAGLSQTDLGKAAGTTRETVASWENRSGTEWNHGAIGWIVAALNGSGANIPVIAPVRSHVNGMVLYADAVQRDAALEAERTPKAKPKCNARTRKGTKCRCQPEKGRKRCKLHGGRSTGPRTIEGRDRIAEAQRQRWANYRQSSKM